MPRYCTDCPADISHKNHNTFRCDECAKKANRIRALKWRKEHSKLNNIYQDIHKDVKRGILPRPSTLNCVDCGNAAHGYDHRDYSKPLDVVPVCRSCNKIRGAADNYELVIT